MMVEKAKSMSSEEDDDESLDEEPGEVIESAPPLKVGEERLLGGTGIMKKLLQKGRGWENPELGDEVTVHFVGFLMDGTRFTSTSDRDDEPLMFKLGNAKRNQYIVKLDGTRFSSTRDRDEPLMFKLGDGKIIPGLDQGIITMKRGERALFTIPPELGYGAAGGGGVPPNVSVQFEVELKSWIRVVDVCKDGGIIKKILLNGEKNEKPGDLDEVLVKYQVTRDDGTLVAQSPDEGIEFHVKDGHLCPAIPKVVVTMREGEKVKLIVQPQYAFGEKNFNDGPAIPLKSAINIDLQLVSFKPVVDVTGDSKVFKKILKEGNGGIPANEGATVTIRYLARLADGTLYEKKGFEGEQPITFIIDEEQVIAGLDRTTATMKKGEQAIVTINHEYGFGSVEVKRDLAVVPPYSDLVYEVEMLDFIKERTPWEMNGQERVEAARKNKEEGNVLFKTGKYQRAAKKYEKAADYVSEDGTYDDDDEKIVKELRVSCSLNGAACSLKLHDFQGAITLCSKVLESEPRNVKALYRRAQAYIETADLFLADLDIKKALEIDPNNREVKLIKQKLKQLQIESDKRDSKLYSNMFTASKKLKVENVSTEKDEMETDQTGESGVIGST